MARNLLNKRYQPPAKGLKDPLFPPINRETRLIVRSVSRRSWKILADRCPNFPRGTPTPTSKSTPTPRTRLYQYRWSRIGASEQGKFQPRRGDQTSIKEVLADYRARGLEMIILGDVVIVATPPRDTQWTVGWILISRIDLEIGRENREINLELVDRYSWKLTGGKWDFVVVSKKQIQHGVLKTRVLSRLLIQR